MGETVLAISALGDLKNLIIDLAELHTAVY